MEPLEHNYRMFTLLCICPASNPVKRWAKYGNFLFLITAFIIHVLALVFSFNFVLLHFKTDLASTFCAGFQISGIIAALFSIIEALIIRHDIQNVFSTIRDIVKTSNFFLNFGVQSIIDEYLSNR